MYFTLIITYSIRVCLLFNITHLFQNKLLPKAIYRLNILNSHFQLVNLKIKQNKIFDNCTFFLIGTTNGSDIIHIRDQCQWDSLFRQTMLDSETVQCYRHPHVIHK